MPSIREDFSKPEGINRNFRNALIFRLAGMALIFLLQILLARLMKPAHYGDYTVIITLVNLLLVGGMFGFDSSTQRFLPVYIAQGKYSFASGFLKYSNRIITFFSLLCSIGLFIFLISNSKKFNISFSEGLFWAVLLIPFLAFLYQASAVLRSLGKVKLSLMSVYFLFPVLMALISYYHFSGQKKLTVDAAMLINLGCTAVICIFINRRAGKILKNEIQDGKSAFERKKWLTVSAFLFLTTIFDLLLKQSDILMVSYYLDNTKAGIYGVAAKLVTITAIGLSVADYVFIPKFAALYETRQLLKLQNLVRNSTLQILLITLPLVIILSVGGKFLLGLFGKIYITAYVPLIILLFGQIVNTLTGMVGGLMMMTGFHKTFLVFYMIAFFIQVLLNMILIPEMGITGAAIGSALSMIILNVITYSFVRKKLKIKASFF
jgi:O-antigen/teichoic acid export membrane protein